MSIIIWVLASLATFIGGIIMLALSQPVYEIATRPEVSSEYMTQAGFTAQVDAIFNLWKLSPMIMFMCTAIFGISAIRRRGQYQ